MFTNLILNTDSYKASHFLQYPAGTQVVSSYIESRGGQFPHTLFFGLQAFIKEYLLKPVTTADIDEAEAVFAAHGVPFFREGWEQIVQQHGGFLPIEIEALPEGMIVPTGNALVQIRNTDPQAFWLTSYLETALLRAVWYPTTVATLSWQVKQSIRQALEATCDNPMVELPFKLHDFGARGVSSHESAALGGMAHLVNFMGSDTVVALLAARKYYGADMAGFSIPAAEHSTITAWGREGETDAYANMLQQFGQAGKILAVVSDSYDIYHAVSEIWGKQLRAQVERSGATVVIRPDSGVPEDIVPEVLERLYAEFGGRVNSKGYKVLSDCVRVIQGDGVDVDSIGVILQRIQQAGFSTENVAFGMGGGLLQKVNRDTLRFAMKASAMQINGAWRDVYKQPITDSGKNSKRGRLAVIKDAGVIKTVREDALSWESNCLRPVFRNGELLVDDDFDVIRTRSNQA
ncbi:MAG TPA: nicotinate phosphoribosyltransferase [Candidatus Thiothrix moscowensis]|uniref:nicotinate phosphoribosyltransferase n=1 Tax=unclassified Thiothrix TaxID=2636184 RepID=UPI0025F5F48A|nr:MULTISPECIES: nicotinate phosphoribosyltransferase [unclassified Thiothrix]HRJ51930.1 nicotinate phosphoribosyltransferase [Candidatus Thiothrix moscowensis]HRJ92245.1 nicotinate phosphoribosyltransferase [Candidatus Thiothrix moscowensis]